MGGLGDTRFNSIVELKKNDQIAQAVYNTAFESIPKIPKAPNVIATGLDKKIVLTWDNIAESYNESDIIDVDENGNPTNYHFEGYAVYQLKNLYDIGTKKLIAVFDRNNGIKNIKDYVFDMEYGEWIEKFVMPCKDNGIRKYIYITVDALNNNEALINNHNYYFAVTAFGYNESGKPKLLESLLPPIEVSPVGPINGIDYSVSSVNEVEHVSGTCDGEVFVNVIDPSHLKGHDYEVYFDHQQLDTVKHWNLRDLTTGEIILENQTVLSGYDIYTCEEVGIPASPIVNGFQISINGSYDAPTDFTKYTHTRPDGSMDVFSHARAYGLYDSHSKPFLITSYADFGWGSYGPTATAWDTYDYSADGAQHGTQSMNLLQLDVELRFTGEYDATTIDMVGGGTYHPITDGTGSLATLASARYYDIKDHPDSNNPGTGDPFLVRIPFEVWDVDNDKQISIVIYDRWGDPTAADMYAFNPADRMYCWLLKEDYATTIGRDAADNTNSDYLTWNLVFWNCDWTSGDKVLFQYDNPIQLGVDVFQFSTTASTNFDIAKGDVNNDGDVNISDAVKLINYILQLDDLTGEQQYAADFNSDLELNIADVVGIVYDILGLSKSLAKSSSQGTVNIGLHEKAAVSDDVVSVPIVMNTDMSLAGMQLELEYDPLLLKPLTPNFSSDKWKRISAVKNSPETGSVIFLFYDLAGSTLPKNDLPVLQFKNISEQSELSANITLVNAVVSNEQGVSVKIEFGNMSASTVPVPESYALHQNYPNPFNPLTTIRYDLPEMSHVFIQIYNMLGQKVRTLVDKKQFAGEYQVQWNARNDQGQMLSSGIYFMQFRAGDFVRHQKVTLLK